jgi:hypothetical protein
MTDTALKPDVFISFSDIGDEAPVEKKDQDPGDVALHAMQNTKGWTVLKEYINHLKQEMDLLVASLIADGRSFEDVGKVTVVSNLAKEKLDDIIRRVEDATDAIGR